MKHTSTFEWIVGFLSSLLLIYLAMHGTDGWQLLVVGAFVGCFVAFWLMYSKPILSARYAMTIALAPRVALVNN